MEWLRQNLLTLILIFFFSALSFVGGALAFMEPYEPRPMLRAPLNENVLWSLVQDYKRESPLQSYTKDNELCDYAKIRSVEVASKWSHDGFARDQGWRFATLEYAHFGENIVKGPVTEDTALFMWLNSPPHRANLDDPKYTHSCIKCTDNHCVQIFGGY